MTNTDPRRGQPLPHSSGKEDAGDVHIPVNGTKPEERTIKIHDFPKGGGTATEGLKGPAPASLMDSIQEGSLKIKESVSDTGYRKESEVRRLLRKKKHGRSRDPARGGMQRPGE